MVAPRRLGNNYIFLILLTALFLSGCSSVEIPKTSSPPPGTYAIAPVFREFYLKLGGEEILGVGISKSFTYQNLECQYTENALLCHDANQTDLTRFSLYPLGDVFAPRDEPWRIPARPNSLLVDGYVVYEEFVPLYQKLKGPLYTGRPLSQARLNSSKQRIEQYFENVGFYRLLSDPPNTVHLLAYGAYACNAECRHPASQSAIILNPSQSSFEEPFLSFVLNAGIFGKPLDKPFTSENGNLEQVYENAVLYSPQDHPEEVHLLPLPEILGYPQNPPGPQRYTAQDGVIFKPTKGNIGYHVPFVFDTFIATHGGYELTGNPISEPFEVEKNAVYRQCYQFVCLDYDLRVAESLRVHLADLGREYLQAGSPAIQPESKFVFSPQSVSLEVGVQKQSLPVNEEQVVLMMVLKTADQKPLSDVEANLSIDLPNDKKIQLAIPPTDKNGRSSVKVPLLESISNGTIIPFTVCLNVPSDEPICAKGSYLIWNY